MIKLAVIGSNSFAASHFIDYALSNTNNEILGVSRRPEKNDIFLPYKKNGNSSRFSFHQFDLNRDMAELLDFLDKEQPENIINYAAQSEVGPSWENPIHWYNTNVIGVVNLTNHLRKQPYVKKYIHISSPEVYGSCEGKVNEDCPFNPSTPYAASKASGDMFIQILIKQFTFPAILVRSTNYYGPGQQLFKIIPRSIIYIKSGKKIQLHGGGRAIKSFIHIRDVCAGMLKIMEKGRLGEIYHLSPPSFYSVRDIVQRICLILGCNFSEVTQAVEERPGQDAAYIISSEKAKQIGWEPKITIDSGLRECVDWVNKNWDVIKKQSLLYNHIP
ncbi:GDP-mannose 4,6-dehydratase [Candidatus Woesearchaeota archaeon]|nr:GDP-mannose 4,6-dehydratase [Candidatus Woesearchaeota archaeon]